MKLLLKAACAVSLISLSILSFSNPAIDVDGTAIEVHSILEITLHVGKSCEIILLNRDTGGLIWQGFTYFTRWRLNTDLSAGRELVSVSEPKNQRVVIKALKPGVALLVGECVTTKCRNGIVPCCGLAIVSESIDMTCVAKITVVP